MSSFTLKVSPRVASSCTESSWSDPLTYFSDRFLVRCSKTFVEVIDLAEVEEQLPRRSASLPPRLAEYYDDCCTGFERHVEQPSSLAGIVVDSFVVECRDKRSDLHEASYPAAGIPTLAAIVQKYVSEDVNNGVTVKWSGIPTGMRADTALDLLESVGVTNFDFLYLPRNRYGSDTHVRYRTKGFAYINFYSRFAALDAMTKLANFSAEHGKKFSFEFSETFGVSAHLKQFKRWNKGVVYIRVGTQLYLISLKVLRAVAKAMGFNRKGENIYEHSDTE